jgi:hypothetical protein
MIFNDLNFWPVILVIGSIINQAVMHQYEQAGHARDRYSVY